MTGNTVGTLFRITSFGESHGQAVGVVIDGCPAGFPLNLDKLDLEMARRRPGQSTLVSPRAEPDKVQILSGVFEGKTTGAPLMAIVFNEDVRSKDYEAIKEVFRPGHADFSYFAKYHHRDHRGGGRASARETVARVIAGAVARQLLATGGMSIRGAVVQIGKVRAEKYLWDQVEGNPVRSVDPERAQAMIEEIETARKDRDSIGGIVEVQALNVPPGLGEPVFGKLDAAIAGALMSIPAAKGVEIGHGFAAAMLRGSEMNDLMFEDGFHSNRHGGILGGISSGAPLVARVVFKPTASIPKAQQTVDMQLRPQTIETLGRHDPCVAIRAVPVAEAMLALVVVDYWLQDCATRSVRTHYDSSPPVNYRLTEN